ncbi:hypothetical protein X777_03551 [Ooceraea biroi]|uniref:Endonuclease/exonuclease/phosphatase domain-containing protein n=1 Tax=Ooceraea biroi TaxID=2015173 RepID=A0A026VV36_OOCBI|nr:hypothetical protein X777_03551 [Ooceraea biroi]
MVKSSTHTSDNSTTYASDNYDSDNYASDNIKELLTYHKAVHERYQVTTKRMVRRNKHRAGRRKRERIEYLLQLRRAQFSDFLRNLGDQPPSRSVSPDKRQSEETATPDPSTSTQKTSSSQLPSQCSESSPQVTECTSSPEESHASTSLGAHVVDIITDTVLQQCEYLALTETWMRDHESAASITGYECISRSNYGGKTGHIAGGVAIYKQIRRPTICRPITIEIDNRMQCGREFGDVCLAEITIDSTIRFILGSVCIHSGSSSREIGMLLYQSLAPYIANNSVHPFVEMDADVPIVLCGDFNVDIMQNTQFVDFMKNTFNIDCATRATTGTTLGNTCLDFTFTRNISVECLNYISYFSYHHPVLNRMVRQLSGLPPAILPSPNEDDRV